jgi:hypothetical protein
MAIFSNEIADFFAHYFSLPKPSVKTLYVVIAKSAY